MTIRTHRLTALVFVSFVMSANTPMYARPCDAPPQVVFRSKESGNVLSAREADGGPLLAAERGVGSWELFTVRNLSRETCEVRSDDRVALLSSMGRWVMVEADGRVHLSRVSAQLGDLMSLSFSSRTARPVIESGDEITLRTSTGLLLRTATGGTLAAMAGVGEPFVVTILPTLLVRLRAAGGQYVTASGGGGSTVVADRNEGSTWQTFRLFRFRGRTGPLMSGEAVALQAWNGQFLSAVGGGGAGMTVDRNRAAEWETYVIEAEPASASIPHGSGVSLRTATNHFVTAEGGGGRELVANRAARAEWQRFMVEFPESVPAPIESMRHSTNPSRPFATPVVRDTARIAALLLLVQYSSMPTPPDPTLTGAIIRGYTTGPAGAIRQWVLKNSYGAQDVDVVFYGPLVLPQSFNYYANSDPRGFDNGRLTDALNAAEGAGLRLSGYDRNRDGVVTAEELGMVMLDFSGCGTAQCGSERPVALMTASGANYQGLVASRGLFLAGGPVQGVAQLRQGFSTLVHEIGHAAYGLPDRYYGRTAIVGDMIADRLALGDWEKFTLLKPSGAGGVQHLDRVYLVNDNTAGYVTPMDAPSYGVNAQPGIPGAAAQLVLERSSGPGALQDGDVVSLRTWREMYLVAEFGGGDAVRANARTAREWERFTVRKIPGSGTGPLQHGDKIALVAQRGQYVTAVPGGRTTDAASISQGYSVVGGCGNGVGGGYDIMDDNCRNLMLSTHDRIKRGWIPAKVLEPSDRGCYRLQPTAVAAEAIILWDPAVPDEYYVVENRQAALAEMDAVPSSGIIISWVSESRDYWRRFGAGDVMWGEIPSVLSRAADTWVPNRLATAPRVNQLYSFGRQASSAAFTSGGAVLPLGDGSLSRFRLSFQTMPGRNMAVCIQ